MAFNMRIDSLKKYTDVMAGVKIYKKDGKNYLERDGKTFDLPSGNISLNGHNLCIDGIFIDIEKYV